MRLRRRRLTSNNGSQETCTNCTSVWRKNAPAVMNDLIGMLSDANLKAFMPLRHFIIRTVCTTIVAIRVATRSIQYSTVQFTWTHYSRPVTRWLKNPLNFNGTNCFPNLKLTVQSVTFSTFMTLVFFLLFVCL